MRRWGKSAREPGRDHRKEDDSKVHNRDNIFQNTVLQRVFLIAAGPKLDALGTPAQKLSRLGALQAKGPGNALGVTGDQQADTAEYR